MSIKDNSKVIIGLTGYWGSGCSQFAKHIAYDFTNILNTYIEKYNENKISELYEKINSLKLADSKKTLSELDNKIKELKDQLSYRELFDILKKDNKVCSDLYKIKFYYISFSSQILIACMMKDENHKETIKKAFEDNKEKINEKYKKNCKDLKFKNYETRNLNLENTTKYLEPLFNKKKSDNFKEDDEKSKEFEAVFSVLGIIKEKIDNKTLQDFGDELRSSPYPGQNQKSNINGRYLAELADRCMEILGEYKYFVIECFKTPQEIYYFREKYGYFNLVAVQAEKKIRIKRIKERNENIKDIEIEIFLDREKGSNKCFFHQDEIKNRNELENKFKGCISISPGCNVITELNECIKIQEIKNNNGNFKINKKEKINLEIVKENKKAIKDVWKECFNDNPKEDITKINVSRCIDIADVAIQNNLSLEDLYEKIVRIIALILLPGSVKPTESETLMHMAYTLSVRSNCLSHQVGAIITNSEGYIIGAGWNDVGNGQISCGLKKTEDYKEYDFLKCNKINQYIKNKGEDKKEKYLCLRELDRNRKLELCPAIHAEENAILQLAKYTSGEIKDAKIYITSFPCTQCLRKIVQININEIIYTEDLDNEFTELYVKQNGKNIKLTPFEGIKSHSYFKFFKPYYDKKEQQNLIDQSDKN